MDGTSSVGWTVISSPAPGVSLVFFSRAAMATAAPRRDDRSAASRREQYRRAEARRVRYLPKGFVEVSNHRGCATSRLGAALQKLLAADTAATPEASEAEQLSPDSPLKYHRAAGELADAWCEGWPAGLAWATTAAASACWEGQTLI